MNGTYFQNPTFQNSQQDYLPNIDMTQEESYIENILRLNKGKRVKVFASFPDSEKYRDRIYDGIIEQAGKDHLVMSEPSKGDWYLIPLIYVNWVEFEEQLTYFN